MKIMRTLLTATMSWGLPNVRTEITHQLLSHTSEHLTSDKGYWVKTMKRPLIATITLGLLRICLDITPEPLSNTREH